MGTLEQERQQRIQVAGDIFPLHLSLPLHCPSLLLLFLSPYSPPSLPPLSLLPLLPHPFPSPPSPSSPPLPPLHLLPLFSFSSLSPPSSFFPLSHFPAFFVLFTLFLSPSSLIKTHYNFLEHRERLCHEVDTIAATNCVFEPPKELQLPRKMKKLRSGETAMGNSLPGKLFHFKFLERTCSRQTSNTLAISHIITYSNSTDDVSCDVHCYVLSHSPSHDTHHYIGRSSGKPPKPTSSKLSSSLPSK